MKPELDAVNAVLATIAPGYHLAIGAGRLMLIGPRDIRTARVRTSDRLWLVQRKRNSLGGTVEQAITQLILWLRDLPRRPLYCWEYLCSEQVGLGNADTVRLLREGGYDDPAKTCCVLCGQSERSRSDWWSLGGVIGPCCMYGRCREG